jgi:hypothetical protein
MAGDIAGTTNLSSLSLAADLNAAGRVTMPSGSSLIAASGATITFLPGAQWSVGTIAAASSLASLAGTGMQVGLFFAASGLSLVCRSGNTLYYFNSAASGAAP